MLADRKIWRQRGERYSLVIKEADGQEVTRSRLAVREVQCGCQRDKLSKGHNLRLADLTCR
jgi:hypothetical protein